MGFERQKEGNPQFANGNDRAPADLAELLRGVLETSFDAFLEVDSAGLIVDLNSQAEKTFGWSRAEAIGQPVLNLVPPNQHEFHEQALLDFVDSGDSSTLNKRIETKFLHRDGHKFPVELIVSPVRRGETDHFIAFVHDITERKRAAEQLRE